MDDTGEVSIAILIVVKEAGHSLGQLLMVVGVQDEVFLGATYTFTIEQGAGGEVPEVLKNDIVREAGQCIPLVSGLLHFVNVQYDESFLGNKIREEENNPTKIH
jgi:hypothetical protein